MLRKIGTILLAPATFTGAVIGLVCYLLTGKHPSVRLLMLFGIVSVAAIVIVIGAALWGMYAEYNSPWEQCKRTARENGTVCKLILAYP